MKVTEEMITLAVDEYVRRREMNEQPLVHFGVQHLLEAALADVPEPVPQAGGEWTHDDRDAGARPHQSPLLAGVGAVLQHIEFDVRRWR